MKEKKEPLSFEESLKQLGDVVNDYGVFLKRSAVDFKETQQRNANKEDAKPHVFGKTKNGYQAPVNRQYHFIFYSQTEDKQQ